MSDWKASQPIVEEESAPFCWGFIEISFVRYINI